MADLDSITVDITRYKLDGIANEMQATLLRSSFSPIVKEGLDASASLFSLDGATLAQSCSIPIHLATLIPAVEQIIATFPVATMRDGDTFILNDPYCGGTHLPDIAVVQPIVHRGRPIALAGGDDTSPGCRRHVRGFGAHQCHRDLSGRAAHPAVEAARGRRLQRDAGRLAASERAHSRYGDGRSQRADCRLHDRRATLCRARRAPWAQSGHGGLRRAPGALRAADPRGTVAHSIRHLPLRRFSRQ